MDCGPTCLLMISKFYGKVFNIEKIRGSFRYWENRGFLIGISKVAESLGILAV